MISRSEVERGDIDSALSCLKKTISSVEMIPYWFERLDVAFHGYNHDIREVFEIPEVRDYVYRLDAAFPFWLFFLSKEWPGLRAIMLCFIPPLRYLTEEGKKEMLSQHLDHLLNTRWWPAMNHICEAAGFPETEIKKLTERVVSYFISGPLLRNND